MNKQILRTTIFAALFAVPFIPFLVSSSLFFPYITTKVFVWRIIIEIVFVAWALLAFIDDTYRPRKSLILYAVGLFLLVIGIADFFGVNPYLSFWSNFERMEGFISLLHLGAFFLVIGSVFRNVDWDRWWNTTLFASALMVCYALLQLVGMVAIQQGGVRVDGTFGNATYLAVYMLLHIFIAILFLWRRWPNTSLRWLYGLLIIGQALILYHTATRGAILGLLGGLILLAVINVRNKESPALRKVSVGILAFIIIVIGSFWLARTSNFVEGSPVLSRFSNIDATEIQGGGRSFVWPMAWEGFKERPILGWGQDNFIYIFQKYYDPEMYRLEPWFDHAHNSILDWMVVGGILGLLGYLSLYVSALYFIWWRSISLSRFEKSVLTALLAAYFFHNLFVFDHLVSYVLFFSFLAYIHSRNDGELLWQRSSNPVFAKRIALPAVAIFLVLILYFVNIKPLMSNIFLIEALKSIQLNDFENASLNFKKAYPKTFLGRQEAVQHMAANSIFIFRSDMSLEQKNEFYGFVREAVVKEVSYFPDDVRIRLIAGSFLSAVGVSDEAIIHLERAKEIMPGKQMTYFELGALYINRDEPELALKEFKEAYELVPEYQEAKILYLVGAIYAGDRDLENELLTKLPEEIVNNDSRIQTTYDIVGR